MGRFTLRDEGKTIALGKVLRYKPATISKADQERINNLADKYEESKEESDINGDQ